MGRIRTIKPEFFKHELLFDAEQETGLPLRLAFAGLWTQCDREGRFVWRPRQLKTDILPYDDGVDFVAVLDALERFGFVKSYTVDGERYGRVPGWNRHQVVNNRETESSIPAPSDDPPPTRAARVPDASPTRHGNYQGEGEGEGERERKGKEREDEDATRAELAAASPPSSSKREIVFQAGVIRLTSDDLENWRKAFPRLDLEAELWSLTEWAEGKGKKWFGAVSAALAAKNRKAPDRPVAGGRQNWTPPPDFPAGWPPTIRVRDPEDAFTLWRRGEWDDIAQITRTWGPPPGRPGCRLPEAVQRDWQARTRNAA